MEEILKICNEHGIKFNTAFVPEHGCWLFKFAKDGMCFSQMLSCAEYDHYHLSGILGNYLMALVENAIKEFQKYEVKEN